MGQPGFAKCRAIRFTMVVFTELFQRFRPRPAQSSTVQPLQIGTRTIPLLVVRNPRARRYLLRVQPDGSARVTIPRGGSLAQAQSFVERHRDWLEQHLQRLQSQPRVSSSWQIGTEIYFRGEPVRIEADGAGDIRFGTERLLVKDIGADLRPAIEHHLRKLGTRELPPRVLELAARHQLPVKRVSVRNQRSRWGSCSRRGTISLNWRLIQTPVHVRDYIIFHELAHLRQMNHSDKFWLEVERLCPDYLTAEKWLKTNRQLLR